MPKFLSEKIKKAFGLTEGELVPGTLIRNLIYSCNVEQFTWKVDTVIQIVV